MSLQKQFSREWRQGNLGRKYEGEALSAAHLYFKPYCCKIIGEANAYQENSLCLGMLVLLYFFFWATPDCVFGAEGWG